MARDRDNEATRKIIMDLPSLNVDSDELTYILVVGNDDEKTRIRAMVREYIGAIDQILADNGQVWSMAEETATWLSSFQSRDVLAHHQTDSTVRAKK